MLHDPAPLQFVSPLTCLQELLVECLGNRSAFINAQQDMLGDSPGGEVKVPAQAAKAWIRGLVCTPDQLQALDNDTLVQCLKVCFLVVFIDTSCSQPRHLLLLDVEKSTRNNHLSSIACHVQTEHRPCQYAAFFTGCGCRICV